MALRRYQCRSCGAKTKFFDDAVGECYRCKGTTFGRLLSIPAEPLSTVTVDEYHNVQQQVGVQEDLRKRTTKHVNDNLDGDIEEYGEKIAKEQGWLRSDDGGKTWRKRTDFDTDTLHSQNSGTQKSGKERSTKLDNPKKKIKKWGKRVE